MDNTDLDVSNNFIDNSEIVPEIVPIIVPEIVATIQPEIVTETQPEIVAEIVPIIVPIIVPEIVATIQPEIVPETQLITEIITEPITQTVIITEPNTITLNNIISETQLDIVTQQQLQQQLQPQQLLQPITQTDLDVSNNINININLKNSINVFDPNVKNIYRPKNSWGPVIWNFIHTISIIDFVDNEMYVNEIKKYLQSVFNILPCKHCCDTYKIWIDKLDTIDINERMVLFKWSVDLHNEVNQKLNKETWSYEQAVEYWCNKLPELPLL